MSCLSHASKYAPFACLELMLYVSLLAACGCRALWFEALAGTVVAFLAVQDRLVVMKRTAPVLEGKQ